MKILWWSICCKSCPSLLFVFPTSAFPQWSDRFTAMTAPFSQSGPIYIYTYMLPDLHQHHHISSLISTRGALRLHTYNWCTTFDNHPIQFIPSAHDVIKIFWSIKLRRSVDLWWLLDPVLQSPLDDLVKLEITFKHGSILCTRMASRGGDIGDNFIVIESCCDEANY